MKIIQPRPFTFEAGPRAVLLLHAYTSHSGDVRSLGRFLEKEGYTTHAPIYSGHGGAPEDIVSTSPEDWFQDVLDGYNHLKSLGHKEIAVAGLSLGGLLSLKLAYTKEVKAVIPMAAPIYFDNKDRLLKTFEGYARQYKQFEQKSQEDINAEVKTLMEKAPIAVEKLKPLIEEVKENLANIKAPTLILQPKRDQLINTDSANYLYNHIASSEKNKIWYEKSGHVVTTGPERDQLHEDIYQFLESLHWMRTPIRRVK